MKFPCKEPFMLYRRTIFLNSNPFMVLISRKGILNRVKKSSECQWKFTKLCHIMQNFGLGFLLLRKKQCWTVDYFYPHKVYFQSWKSQFQQQGELLEILLGNAGCALYHNYKRNETQSIHTIFNSLKEHLIHRVISLRCCE